MSTSAKPEEKQSQQARSPQLRKFGEVFKEELEGIRQRRQVAGFDEQAQCKGDNKELSKGLAGLALSGGGIRSATFSLGLLQSLHKYGLLRAFDYLSTVSGGGYTGGWWSAWLSRNGSDNASLGALAKPAERQIGPRDDLFPQPEENEIVRSDRRFDDYTKTKYHLWLDEEDEPEPGKTAKPMGAESAGIDPIHHLRMFANYLTPRRGVMSRDTWRAVAVITRNLTMTWLIMLPLLVALVLLGQLYYVLHPNPVGNFILYPGLTSANPDNFVGIWEEEVYKPFERELEQEQKEKQSVWAENPQLAQSELEQWEDDRQKLIEERDEWILAWMTKNSIWPVGTLMEKQQQLHTEALKTRLRHSLQLVIALGGWIILAAIVWLILTLTAKRGADWYVISACLASVAGIILILLFAADLLPDITKWLLDRLPYRVAWAVVALAIVAFIFWPSYKREAPDLDKETRRQWRFEVLRNRATLVHSTLLGLLVVSSAVLAISGFGHEVINYPYSRWLATSGGLIMIAAAVAGMLFIAYKLTPKGGGDKRETAEPKMLARAVFTVTPMLVVVGLSLAAAWIGHRVLVFFYEVISESGSDLLPFQIRYLHYAAFFGVAVCFILAMYEMDWKRGKLPFYLYLSFLAPAVAAAVILLKLIGYYEIPNLVVLNVLAIIIFGLGFIYIFYKVFVIKRKEKESDRQTSGGHAMSDKLGTARLPGGAVGRAAYFIRRNRLVGKAGMLLFYGYWVFYEYNLLNLQPQTSKASVPENLHLLAFPITLLVAATFAGGAILYRLALTEVKGASRVFEPVLFKTWCREHRRDAMWLIPSACIVLAIICACAAHWFLMEYGRSDNSTIINAIAPNGEGLIKFLERLNVVEICLKPLLQDKLLVPVVGLPLAVLIIVTLVFFIRKLFQIKRVERARRRREKEAADNNTAAGIQSERTKLAGFKGTLLIALLIILSAIAGIYALLMALEVLGQAASKFQLKTDGLTSLTLAGVVLCLSFVRFEITWGRGDNRHSLWLLAFAYVALIMLLIQSFLPSPGEHFKTQYGFIVFGLLAILLTWVTGLGWMADPNAFSMHAFYKWRLVRAYMGASNNYRRVHDKEITEAAAGDDVLLKDLKNCERGAPYHLINTTLNIVAARDLAIAQRSAASFVLSQLYCGSSRTWYRNTSRYMDGRLSLGTAVAISGAAASPNMGSRTPTSALAMLLTLLNVRLGYWAPTPHKKDWTSPQPRLWPFYLMREFLSRTSDVSSYCYLTDGGHFDNTGIYSLVERGCRFIVAADCGADPKPCFEDLGNVIRRCRIDFGAEIKLDIQSFIANMKDDENEPVPFHFAVGTIKYSPEHLKKLKEELTDAQGMKGQNDEGYGRDGIIIFFKPSLTALDTADVRQYALENSAFPHTTTANQWFDEAQFESYRRLGQLCAESALDHLNAAQKLKERVDTCKGAQGTGALAGQDWIHATDVEELFNEALKKASEQQEAEIGKSNGANQNGALPKMKPSRSRSNHNNTSALRFKKKRQKSSQSLMDTPQSSK